MKRRYKLDKFLSLVLIFCFIIFFIFSFHEAGLFFFGAIWRWSQNQCAKHQSLQSPKYKYSFINIFYKMNQLVQKIKPPIFSKVITTLTPILFIQILALIIGSQIPYWFVLIGSLFYDIPDLSQIWGRFSRQKQKAN